MSHPVANVIRQQLRWRRRAAKVIWLRGLQQISRWTRRRATETLIRELVELLLLVLLLKVVLISQVVASEVSPSESAVLESVSELAMNAGVAEVGLPSLEPRHFKRWRAHFPGATPHVCGQGS